MIALLGYNAMQIGLCGLFAAAAAGFFSDNLGINLPWWVYAFVALAIIAVLGYRQVDLSVKVLSILVSLEFLIVLILDAAILIQGGQGGTGPVERRAIHLGRLYQRLDRDRTVVQLRVFHRI